MSPAIIQEVEPTSVEEHVVLQLQEIIRQKENDATLAAAIGRTLLDRNNKLEEENQLLSEKVTPIPIFFLTCM